MSAEIFVDANILVYAHDLDAGEKHEQAKVLVRDLWNQPQPPAISVQVLQELFVNLHRAGFRFPKRGRCFAITGAGARWTTPRLCATVRWTKWSDGKRRSGTP